MQEDPNAGRLMDSRFVAQFLDVSEATVCRMRQDRSGPAFVLVRGRPRYRLGAIHSWIDSQELQNGAE
jgi:hypothetical protein